MKELALHILDIFYNSTKANASRIRIIINEDTRDNLLSIKITDNGCGMSREFVKNIQNPFVTTRTTRKVGMGVPLLKLAANQCGGNVTVRSKKNFGTMILATFVRDHIDRAPLGDMKETIIAMVLSLGKCDLTYIHRIDDREAVFDTREIREVLGDGIDLGETAVISWIKGYLEELEEDLYASKQN